VRLVYLDESNEDNKFYVYRAVIVDVANWSSAFAALRNIRQTMKAEGGIYVRQELHAWKFACGKGKTSTRAIYKDERARIFRWILESVASTGLFRVISSVHTNEFFAFERTMNRINRTALAHGHDLGLVCDEGQESQFT
jgi:hypothetical protein